MSTNQSSITVQKVSDRIYGCLGPGGLSSTGIFIGDRAVLVADTTLTPSLARQVKAAVREVTGLPIRYVLNTHGDGDHVFGNQEFRPEAVLMTHRLTRERLLKQGDEPVRAAAARRPHWKAEFDQIRVVAPEIGFDGDLEIDLGGLVLQCLFVGPAHTPGDVVVWEPESRVLMTADVVFNGIFPGARNADILGWIRTLERLEQLRPEAIIPGHGAVGDAALLGVQRAVLTEVRDTILAARAQGLTLEQALQNVRFPQYESLAMAGDRIRDAIARVYAEAS